MPGPKAWPTALGRLESRRESGTTGPRTLEVPATPAQPHTHTCLLAHLCTHTSSHMRAQPQLPPHKCTHQLSHTLHTHTCLLTHVHTHQLSHTQCTPTPDHSHTCAHPPGLTCMHTHQLLHTEYTHLHLPAHTCAHMPALTHVYTYICTHMRAHIAQLSHSAHPHLPRHTQQLLHAHMCIPTPAHSHTCAHTPILTHAHPLQTHSAQSCGPVVRPVVSEGLWPYWNLDLNWLDPEASLTSEGVSEAAAPSETQL